MARISDQGAESARLTPIEGIKGAFALDLDLDQIEEMQAFEENGSAKAMLLWLGEHLLRDENGDPFEDLTPTEIGTIKVTKAKQIVSAVIDHLDTLKAGNESDSGGP